MLRLGHQLESLQEYFEILPGEMGITYKIKFSRLISDSKTQSIIKYATTIGNSYSYFEFIRDTFTTVIYMLSSENLESSRLCIPSIDTRSSIETLSSVDGLEQKLD